jgi:glycosyltransferase involved in cell wall biosynthesis
MKNQQLAPICMFTYNRLEETKQTIIALQQNFLAQESELFVFSDGPKNEKAASKIQTVREYLATVEGFKKVTIVASEQNKGLAKSIISGVSRILETYDSVVVVEDDLVSTPNFLDFMNQTLDFYKEDRAVFSISGYTMNLPSLKNEKKDFYFGYRASSWGWGIWKDRWLPIDWEVKDYSVFVKDKIKVENFRRGGSDMPRMLKNQMTGKIDSWAIRFCYHQFKENLMTVFPTISKIKSIGFSEEATHTSGTKRFITPIDSELKRIFSLQKFTEIDKKLIKEFSSFFSVKNRIINQLRQKIKF